MAEETGVRRWRGRRRIAAVAALCLAVLVVTVAVASSAGGDEEGDEAATRSTATTQIERKDLVESEEVDGTLGYADSRTVINRLSGTVTWLPAQGTVVKTGERLFEVEGKSVYLFDGTYPAYRSLEAGREGRDVAQLERTLRELGFDENKDMAIDGEWDSATTAAVQRWQRNEGLDEDGSIEVGRVVFQPGDRRIGEQLADVGGSADGGGGGGGGTGATSGASFDGASQSTAATGRTSFASLPVARSAQVETPTPTPTPTPIPSPTPTPTPTPTSTPTPTPEPTPSPQPEPTPSAPSTGGGAPSGGGFSGGGGGGSFGGGGATAGAATVQDSAASGEQSVATEIMTTTSRRRVVTVDLLTTRVRLAQRGAEVEVEMPDGSDVEGRIAKVGRVAESTEQSDGSESDPTIELTIRLKKTKGFVIDQAPVDVQLEQRRAEDVLTVPVTALLAQTGGRFAVEVVEGGRRRVVPVEPGLYTDGDVEIEGQGLEEGMTVTDARV